MREIVRVDASEYKEYACMFNEYLEYLCCGVEPYEENCFQWVLFYQYFSNKDLRHYFVKEDGDICGFISIMVGDDIPEGCDWYIVDTYIRGEYQGKGYGEWMIEQIQGLYEGTVFLQIKRGNDRAKAFWGKMFAGYEDLRDRYDYLDNDYCLAYAYSKKF